MGERILVTTIMNAQTGSGVQADDGIQAPTKKYHRESAYYSSIIVKVVRLFAWCSSGVQLLHPQFIAKRVSPYPTADNRVASIPLPMRYSIADCALFWERF